MEPPKSSSILPKSSNILHPIRCVRFTKAVVRHANIRDQNPSFGMICPGDPHQRNRQCSKTWGSVSRRYRVARARCPRSSVEAGQKCIKIKGARKSNILLTFGELVSTCINNETRGKRICCRLRSVDAHDLQKGFEFRWIGNRDDIEKSDNGYNSQWRGADGWRGHSLSENWRYSWQWKSSRIRQQFYRWESFALNMDTHFSGSTVRNHISF